MLQKNLGIGQTPAYLITSHFWPTKNNKIKSYTTFVFSLQQIFPTLNTQTFIKLISISCTFFRWHFITKFFKFKFFLQECNGS